MDFCNDALANSKDQTNSSEIEEIDSSSDDDTHSKCKDNKINSSSDDDTLGHSTINSKFTKYDNTVEAEFDEDDTYSFLNEIKINYNSKSRFRFKNFMLVYKSHLEYDFITKQISYILSKKGVYDSTYFLSSYLNSNNNVYNRTYVYINMKNVFQTTREIFNLKYKDIILIPCIRIIPTNRLLDTKMFIYRGGFNFPYSCQMEDYERNREIYTNYEIPKTRRIRSSKKKIKSDNETQASSITDTTIYDELRREIEILKLDKINKKPENFELLNTIRQDNRIIKENMSDIILENKELKCTVNRLVNTINLIIDKNIIKEHTPDIVTENKELKNNINVLMNNINIIMNKNIHLEETISQIKSQIEIIKNN